MSFGIGFLLSAFGSDEEPEQLVRYEVKLLDGSDLALYSASHDFEVDDCVEISMHEDLEQHPPSMKRNKDACVTE